MIGQRKHAPSINERQAVRRLGSTVGTVSALLSQRNAAILICPLQSQSASQSLTRICRFHHALPIEFPTALTEESPAIAICWGPRRREITAAGACARTNRVSVQVKAPLTAERVYPARRVVAAS